MLRNAQALHANIQEISASRVGNMLDQAESLSIVISCSVEIEQTMCRCALGKAGCKLKRSAREYLLSLLLRSHRVAINGFKVLQEEM